MESNIFLGISLAGLLFVAAMTWAQRRQLAGPRPALGATPPPVSVLKPLKGTDADLEANLESFFRLDYPDYEVILGTRDAADSALEVARRVAAAHPTVPSRVIADSREIGLNPKVNNLANLARHARHDVLLISDSNVRVPPHYLGDMVAHLEREGVGLVSSPIRGPRGDTLGATLEGLQLNTFVMGGTSAMHNLLGGVCVVGKSMLLRRTTLERVGGFRFLARFLAEDQVCGQEVARLGLRTALTGVPVDNVLAPIGVREFLARHLRWARIRRHISPAGYAGELLLNPVAVATVGAFVLADFRGLAIFAATLLAKSALDAAAERRLGVRRALLFYPLLVAAKDMLIGAAWPVSLFSSTVTWRGNVRRIGPRTLLSPVTPAPAAPPVKLDLSGDDGLVEANT